MFIKARRLPTLAPNAWRQACRMAIGSWSAWALATLMAWPYASFYAVYPLVLMGLVSRLDLRVALQFLGASSVALPAAGIMIGRLSQAPLVMTLAFSLFSAGCLIAMTGGRLFLFGAFGLVACSSVVHLGSYSDVSWDHLFLAQWRATFVSVLVAAVAYACAPDLVPRAPASPVTRSRSQVRHLILLGTMGSTASFVVFQLIALSDSLAAQIGSVLILLAMSRDAIWNAGRTRLAGTLSGTLFALVIQVCLEDYSRLWGLLACAYWLGLILFSVDHTREGRGPGHGFAGVTSLAILFGQLSPQEDLIGSALYRSASLMVSVSLMLVFISTVHWILNRFSATRW